MGKPGPGSVGPHLGSQGGRTRHLAGSSALPPLYSLMHSFVHIHLIPQEHLKPPQEDAPAPATAVPTPRFIKA